MSLMENMAGGGGTDTTTAPPATPPTDTTTAPPVDTTTTPASSDWMLPDEYKANESVGKFVKDGKIDRDALLKGYVNAAELVGRDKIIVPKTDEEYAAAFSKLGKPESPDKYVVTKPDKMPEGVEYDEDGEKFLRDFAHQNHYTQKQFEAAYKTYYERQQGMVSNWHKMDQAAATDCETALRKEHGQAYDGFFQAGSTALQEYADPDFLQFLQQKGLANDPRMIRVFGRIGTELKGDTKLKGDGGGVGNLTPEQWDAKIRDFRAEHSKVLMNSDDRDYRRRADELQQMYRNKHGEK